MTNHQLRKPLRSAVKWLRTFQVVAKRGRRQSREAHKIPRAFQVSHTTNEQLTSPGDSALSLDSSQSSRFHFQDVG
ncbi:hypothetical protein Fuma_00269 [Fuerstiella marisgermanici]|uniref:Uncharacterized protein n=1 Tax=Fuerstiella marisgermanici TaxID=1891926 RepID=A0A1P8W9F0_9PLAN|nr:hypothetical protein Fuma_00269 [Fuerstiella marisgermanici]